MKRQCITNRGLITIGITKLKIGIQKFAFETLLVVKPKNGMVLMVCVRNMGIPKALVEPVNISR